MAETLYSPEMAFSALYPQHGEGMDVSTDGGSMDPAMMQYKLSAEVVRRSSFGGGMYHAHAQAPEQVQRPATSAGEWMGWDSQHHHQQQQRYQDISRGMSYVLGRFDCMI
jgi:hypothetical protein